MSAVVDVSVAICTWNRARVLDLTLGQLARVRVPRGLSWELLVVNNNCTDDTDSVVRRHESHLPVKLLHEFKPGISNARNLAIARASADLLLFTDDDVLVDSEWFNALADGLQDHGADIAFGRSRPRWPGTTPPWYSSRLDGYFALLDYGPSSFVVTDEQFPFYGLNCGVRVGSIRRLGGFRADFGFRGEVGGVGEDTDLFLRALAAGCKVVYLPEAIVEHIVPEERTTKRFHRRRQWLANGQGFQYLPELYPDVPFLLGLPRFFFSKAIGDFGGYLKGGAMMDRAEVFHYELQLLRFVRFLIEAGKNGFRPGSVPRQSAPRVGDA